MKRPLTVTIRVYFNFVQQVTASAMGTGEFKTFTPCGCLIEQPFSHIVATVESIAAPVLKRVSALSTVIAYVFVFNSMKVPIVVNNLQKVISYSSHSLAHYAPLFHQAFSVAFRACESR